MWPSGRFLSFLDKVKICGEDALQDVTDVGRRYRSHPLLGSCKICRKCVMNSGLFPCLTAQSSEIPQCLIAQPTCAKQAKDAPTSNAQPTEIPQRLNAQPTEIPQCLTAQPTEISQCLIAQPTCAKQAKDAPTSNAQPTEIPQRLNAQPTEIPQCLIAQPTEIPQCLIVHHIYNGHLPTFKAYVTKLTSENLAMIYATDVFLKQVQISNLSLCYKFKVITS